MARTRNRSGARGARSQLLGAGLTLVAAGVGLLVAPAFMRATTIARPIADGLRLPALMALVLGAALIALHFGVRAAAQREPKIKQEPTWTSWAPPEALAAGAGILAPVDEPVALPAAVREAPSPAPRPRETGWSQQVFDDIEWRRFEAVCERLFAQGGFETRSQSHGADGGVDIWLHSKHAQGPAAVVQCKHWSGRQVGVKEMREFFGVMASHQLKRGTFATTATFTADALQFARDNGINAMHGERLLDLIAKRTAQQQAELLAAAYEGEYWRPTCASCGVKMVERKPKATAVRFWGCINFPRCKSKLPMRGAVA